MIPSPWRSASRTGDRPRLLIHAGIHKTGSTSLQSFLAQNRAALRARDIHYPGDTINHTDLAWRLLRRQHGPLRLTGADSRQIPSFLRRAPRSGTLVLSAEDFARSRRLDWLRALRAEYRVEVVFFLRRQDHWLNSWYNQWLKWPPRAGLRPGWLARRRTGAVSPQDFLDLPEDYCWIDYDRLTRRWAAAVGAENIRLFVVEKEQTTDTVQAFAGLLALDDAALARPKARSNESLPVHLLGLLRHFDVAGMSDAERQRLHRAMRKALADKAPAAGTVFAPQVRRDILARYAEGNRAVARRFFGREALFLEPPPADDAPWYEFPELSREELQRDWIAPVEREMRRAGDPPPRPAAG